MAGNTAFYAFKERIEQEFFRNIFCFWMVTELWVNSYLIFGRTFPRGCQWCNLGFLGNTSRWKYFFFKIAKISFSRNLGKNLCPFPSKKTPGTTIKNGLFSCRLTHSMKWFSLENLRFRRFNWILRGKSPAELSKKGLRWQKNNWGKWFSTSIDLILEIVSSHRTIFFRILAESFKQGCQYCILRVEMNIFRKDIFYWNKLSISIYFTILRKKILDIQRKKSILSELHLICPEAKLYEKMFFSGFDTILHICSDCDESTFESSAKKSPMGSPNCLVHFRMKDSNEMAFFRTFHIQIFFQTLSGKIPSSGMKT